MNKFIESFKKPKYGILLIIIVIFSLAVWFYIDFTKPKEIHLVYDGIKYQAGDMESTELIRVEIQGKYSRELFTGNAGFNGIIKLGEKNFTGREIVFNKYKMASLDSDEGHFGMIFIDDLFEKITVEINEKNENGGYSLNAKNGWLISAPSKDREKAVEISKELLQKLHKDLAIK